MSLRFAWPQDFTAQVSATTVETEGGNPPERNQRSFELRLEGTGEERRLVTGRPPPTGPGAVPAELPLPPTPTVVLGPAGELKRIEGTAQIVAELFKDAESKGVPPAQVELLSKVVGEALEQAARERWKLLIGEWNGLTLKPGEVVERKGQMTMPLFGGSIDTRARLILKERVPCAEGGTEKRCVRLVLDSTMDPASSERTGRELIQRMREFMQANSGMPAAMLPEMKVTKLQLDSSLELISEPETLIPHRLRATGNAVVAMQDAEGEAQNLQFQSERSEVFTPGAR